MQLLHLGTIQEELSPAALVYYVLAPRIRDHKSSKKAQCRFTLNIRLSTSLCPRKPLWPVLSANVPQATPKIPGIWAVDDNRPTNVMLHLWDKREVSRINPFFTSIFVVWGGEVHSTYPPSQGRNELQKLKSCHLGKQEGGRLRSNTVRSKSLMLQDYPCYCFLSCLYALTTFLLFKFRAFKLINVFLWERSSFLQFW